MQCKLFIYLFLVFTLKSYVTNINLAAEIMKEKIRTCQLKTYRTSLNKKMFKTVANIYILISNTIDGLKTVIILDFVCLTFYMDLPV